MDASRETVACPLCGPDPSRLLWRDDRLRVIAVDDASYPGYTRVIWQAHVAEMTDLDAGARDHAMAVVYEVERAQRDLLRPDKINLAAFGNMVPHLHWHVIPRWRDDRHFPDAVWAAPRREDDAGALAARRARVPAYEQALARRLAGRLG